MNLSEVYIKNFRNIKEVTLSLSKYSVILGKNNEGKTNIMKAIYRGWNIINDFSTHYPKAISAMIKRDGFRIKYNSIPKSSKEIVEDDITLVPSFKTKDITIGFYFDLTSEEKVSLYNLLKSKTVITDKIYIEVKYDEYLRYKCKVKLNIDGRFLKSSENILTSVLFIIEKFDIDYIPSIRTEETATEIIKDAVNERLNDLTLRDDYNKAIGLVNELQDQELKKLSEQIEPVIKRYLKNIKSIEVKSMKSTLPKINYGYLRDVDIYI
ncbi:TPA: AAA family ATPase [Staphylococcus aureus]|nr:AAA family ATPase [Staphylococcus aureus]PZG42769.1 hypothetical protein C7R36_13130 [Staphylococcus aureus]PZG71139.1 hypothetical protein C7R29_14300 [Staphylococcus aureus]PZI34079.1 hypothetical protein C7R37_14220 [Staphylococcus aureus]CAC6170221.1 recombination protein F [Staphylococcus aureus]HCX9289753.1 AAA family ATPase [Staphylococcus aureus]